LSIRYKGEDAEEDQTSDGEEGLSGLAFLMLCKKPGISIHAFSAVGLDDESTEVEGKGEFKRNGDGGK